MKALVLAAGLGKRLRPLTDSIPKPLIDLNGVPVIDRITDRLEAEGVREFGFNLHHLPEALRSHLSARLGDRAFFRLEESLLDTGGSIASFAGWAGGEDFLVVHNGDICSDIPVSPLVDDVATCDASLALVRRGGASDNVRMSLKSREITDMRGLLGASPEGTALFTFAGIAVYSRRFLDMMPEGRYSVVYFITDSLRAGSVKVRGVVFEGAFWSDIGTPESLDECRKALGKWKR